VKYPGLMSDSTTTMVKDKAQLVLLASFPRICYLGVPGQFSIEAIKNFSNLFLAWAIFLAKLFS